MQKDYLLVPARDKPAKLRAKHNKQDLYSAKAHKSKTKSSLHRNRKTTWKRFAEVPKKTTSVSQVKSILT
jgi:hypothetical protein